MSRATCLCVTDRNNAKCSVFRFYVLRRSRGSLNNVGRSLTRIAKPHSFRDLFRCDNCVLRGRLKDFATFGNTWQVHSFVRVAKALAGVVDLERIGRNVLFVAGAAFSHLGT